MSFYRSTVKFESPGGADVFVFVYASCSSSSVAQKRALPQELTLQRWLPGWQCLGTSTVEVPGVATRTPRRYQYRVSAESRNSRRYASAHLMRKAFQVACSGPRAG